MRIRISTTSHVRICIKYCKSRATYEDAMKSMVHMIKSWSPYYQAIPKKISLICCHWHCYLCCMRTRNNTHSNNLVIFSRISLYYGDTYVLSPAYGKKFSQTKIVLLTIIAIVNFKKNSIMHKYSEQVKTPPWTVHSRLHALHNVAGWLAIVRLVLTASRNGWNCLWNFIKA